MLKIGLFVLCFAIFVIWQGSTLPANNNTDSNNSNTTLVHNSTRKRILTPEENDMANAARAHIAKVLEKNLIRFFAAFTAQQRKSRQEEEELDDEDTTFNTNTLPQVAQLLGAIFSGNVNLTSVVDQAFYLVPQTVRNQVNGIFKLLSGQSTEEPPSFEQSNVPPHIPIALNTSSQQSRPIPKPRPKPRTRPTKAPSTTEGAPDAYAAFVPIASVVSTIENTSKKEIKYKTNHKIPPTPAPIPEEDVSFQDDELIHLEKELVMKAKEYVPYVKKKEPRFFLNSLQELFRNNNTNLTQIIRVMPDLFKGARQAFVLLEELGVLPEGIFPGLDADDED